MLFQTQMGSMKVMKVNPLVDAATDESVAELRQVNGKPLPHSLDIIGEYLKSFHPPDAAFDPNGEWDHRYVMWMALKGSGRNGWLGGRLRIKRRLTSLGIELTVSQATVVQGSLTARTRATVVCGRDRLSTPRNWEIESEMLDGAGKQVDYTKTRITGKAAEDAILQLGKAERKLKVSKPFTSNWCLFDAVQRLPFNTKPLRFDMLEDLELVKLDQRLAYGRSVELELGGRNTRLHSFEQIGRGILPYTYWLDDQHRLLFAVGGLRTFIIEPNVSITEDKQ